MDYETLNLYSNFAHKLNISKFRAIISSNGKLQPNEEIHFLCKNRKNIIIWMLFNIFEYICPKYENYLNWFSKINPKLEFINLF